MIRRLRSAIGVMIVSALALFMTNFPLRGNAASTLTPARTVLTTTLTITSANNGQTFKNYRISTTSGDCVDMNGATGVTLESSNIGPCGVPDNPRVSSRGIYINGGSNNKIYDNYIHVQGASSTTVNGGCCDSHDGILENNGATGDVIQGNVIAYSETNIVSFGSNLTIIGNFLLNPQGAFPRGEQMQLGFGSGGGPYTVNNNFLLSTPDGTIGPAIGTDSSAAILMGQDNTSNRPSDNMSFYEAQGVTAENNFITGGLDATTAGSGGCQDPTGCGVIADGSKSLGANNVTIENNILLNTGGCGINIATGTNQVVENNKVISQNSNGGAQTAFVVWNEYSPTACGPVTLNRNIGTLVRSNAYASGYWKGTGCDPVTCDGTNTNIDSCNTFDYGSGRSAYKSMIINSAVNKPPLIPPLPKNCVANSPYSTQTSMPPC